MARSEGGRLENRKREGAGQLGMSEPLSCEERGGFCAVRTLSERCQNTVRTLSERCQNGQVSVRTGVGAPQTRFRAGRLQDSPTTTLHPTTERGGVNDRGETTNSPSPPIRLTAQYLNTAVNNLNLEFPSQLCLRMGFGAITFPGRSQPSSGSTVHTRPWNDVWTVSHRCMMMQST